jgi:hypothetical protein
MKTLLGWVVIIIIGILVLALVAPSSHPAKQPATYVTDEVATARAYLRDPSGPIPASLRNRPAIDDRAPIDHGDDRDYPDEDPGDYFDDCPPRSC